MRLVSTSALLVLLLAGCHDADDAVPSRAGAKRMAARAPAVASPSTATPAPAPAREPMPARLFACDGGHRVELLPDAARVTLVDGRIVDVPAEGATYRGEALTFIPSGDHGTLAQDEVGAFPCRRTD